MPKMATDARLMVAVLFFGLLRLFSCRHHGLMTPACTMSSPSRYIVSEAFRLRHAVTVDSKYRTRVVGQY